MIEPLAARFSALESAREATEAELAVLSPAQTAFRMHDAAWNVAEVVDHVVRVEQQVLEGARKPNVQRAAWRRRRFRRLLAWLVFGLGVRIRVPERVKNVKPERNTDLKGALARWGEVRTEWRGFLSSITPDQLDLLAIKHPLAGPFTYRDVLKFLEWHLRHHQRQIGRITRAAAAAEPPPGMVSRAAAGHSRISDEEKR